MKLTTTVIEAKIEAFKKELPWLGIWLEDYLKLWKFPKIESIKMERADLGICQRTPRGGLNSTEEIYLFDQNGTRLGTVGYEPRSFWKGFRWLRRYMSIEQYNCLETVKEAILRPQGEEKPYFLVSAYEGFSRNLLCRSVDIVIYKPKGSSLLEWLESLRSSQSDSVQRTLTEIG